MLERTVEAEIAYNLNEHQLLPLPPDSAVRRIHDEGILLLGGGRALLMQIAHPLVAEGVSDHSSYATERWKRLLRTLRPMNAIVFGDEHQARQAADGINHAHRHVRGDGYDALDPDLLLWVLATLIDTALDTHSRFLGLLSACEAEAYYADMCRVGLSLKIPPEHLPRDLTAFREYFERTLSSIQVSDTARSISRDLLRTTAMNWPFMLPLRFMTAGMLPPRLREQYGLEWSAGHEKALRGLQRVSRLTLPRLPLPLRRTPWFLMPSKQPSS